MHHRSLAGTLLRAACCRAHADGSALVLITPNSDANPGLDGTPDGGAVAAHATPNSGRSSSMRSSRQTHDRAAGSAAAPGAVQNAALDRPRARPGMAVQTSPAPSPGSSPQKPAPQQPAASAPLSSLAAPCSAASQSDDAAQAARQPAVVSSAAVEGEEREPDAAEAWAATATAPQQCQGSAQEENDAEILGVVRLHARALQAAATAELPDTSCTLM